MSPLNNQNPSRHTCPKCQSNNIGLVLDTEVKTKRRGLLSWIWWIFLAIITSGLILIIPLLTNYRTKSKSKRVALCQECGHKFKS